MKKLITTLLFCIPIVASACNDIAASGGVNDGVTDNTTAFNSAVAAGPAGRKCVYFGPGKWAFTGAISYTIPATTASLTILGAGTDVTELSFPNTASGITITFDGPSTSAHVRDVTLTTGQANAGTVALTYVESVTSIPNPAISALSDVTNVTFRGSDGYAMTDYWTKGISIGEVSNITFSNVQGYGSSAIAGYGIEIDGTSTAPPVQFNFYGCNIDNLTYGLVLGNYSQGATVNQSNFTGDTYGIIVPGGETGMDQLTVTGSQFNAQYGIAIESEYHNTMIANNLFIVSNLATHYGIYDSAAVLFTISGNTFQNSGAPSLNNNPIGVYLNNTAGVAGALTGNTFRYMSPAIYLGSAASGVNIQSNAYFNNNTNVSNNGTGNTVGGGSQ